MALFDALIEDLASRFGLGSTAAPLTREALALIVGAEGGLGGFINLFKSAKLDALVASWLGGSDPQPLTAGDLGKALGAPAIDGIAHRVGIALPAASAGLAFALPETRRIAHAERRRSGRAPGRGHGLLAPESAHAAPEAARAAPVSDHGHAPVADHGHAAVADYGQGSGQALPVASSVAVAARRGRIAGRPRLGSLADPLPRRSGKRARPRSPRPPLRLLRELRRRRAFRQDAEPSEQPV